MSVKPTVTEIDALLPQTQCGQCGYNGCKPYATAIIEQNEAIDRCPPGGTTVLLALGDKLGVTVTPWLDDMAKRQLSPQLAQIKAVECIGCTKCLQACPVDAIIGAAKQLHTIINAECTGCGLCLPPCPVDCIELLPIPRRQYLPERARQRFEARTARKAQVQQETQQITAQSANLADKKAEILAAVARAKAKKQAAATKL